MLKEEKKYQEYIEDKLPVPDIKDRIKSRIEFKKKEGLFKMINKKLVIGLSSGVALAATVGIVVGVCAFNTSNQRIAPQNAKAVVNMDVNPSLEFTIDENNKVISVKGLNDEGSLIIYGEAFIGKDINDVINACIKVETETGYLIANADASKNNISISITADDNGYVEELGKKLKESALSALEKCDVKANIELTKKYTHEKMEELALAYDPTLTEDEVKKMSYKDLAKVIAIYHIDTSDIYSEKIEELYVEVRDRKIESAKIKPVQDAIEGADIIYKSILQTYTTFVGELQSYYDGIENLTYATFVDPNSEYQKEYKKVKDAKEDVLKYRQEVANCDHSNETLYAATLAYLDAADLVLSAEQAALDTVELAGTTAIETYKTSIRVAINSLRSIEKAFPSGLKEYLNSKTQDLDKVINEEKEKAFKEFEKEYSKELDDAKNEMKLRKESLKEAIKNA